MRMVIRGFVGRQVIFKDHVEMADDDDMDVRLPGLVEKHTEYMKDYPKFMIEVEFLEEPDPEQRFLRFGTDPTIMVDPIEVGIDGGE